MVNPDWQRLVEENLDLARSVAWRYIRKGLGSGDPAIDVDDMMALAVEGLIRAAKRYNPELGCRFSTYAVWHITGRILKAFRRHHRGFRVPDHMPASHRPPVCSLDSPVGEDRENVLGDLVASTGHTEVEDAVVVRAALERLPAHFRELLVLRAQGWTQEEVSRKLGMSQGNVSRLERRARRELLTAISD